MWMGRYGRVVANGALRPWVVAGAVIAVIVGAAVRGQPEDPHTEAAVTPVAEVTTAPESVGEPPGDEEASESRDATGADAASPAPKRMASPENPGPAASAGQEFGEHGTRRLTGHEGRTVALTFDDGPHPRHTAEVLDILGGHQVTATFCLVGDHSQRHPDLVRRIVADGHALCNHTRTHDMSLRDRSDAGIAAEITDTEATIRSAIPDADIGHFRAPGGYFAANVNRVAEDHGLTPLGWSVDTEDWRRPGAETIRARIIENVHPGAVVLMHDGGGDRTGTVEALPGVIVALQAMGYEFVVPAR